MIIWGSGGTTKDLGVVETRRCESCEQVRPFKMFLSYRYGHIWYLFKWVQEKQYSLACTVCERGWKLETRKVEPTLKTQPIPWGTRYGWLVLIGLVAALIGGGAIAAQVKEHEDLALVAAPRTGDLYVTDLAPLMKHPQAPQMWGLMRIKALTGDDAELEISESSYNVRTGPSHDVSEGKITEAGYFGSATLTLPRAKLQEMRAKRLIAEVIRR
jgi:hypothetical protein